MKAMADDKTEEQEWASLWHGRMFCARKDWSIWTVTSVGAESFWGGLCVRIKGRAASVFSYALWAHARIFAFRHAHARASAHLHALFSSFSYLAGKRKWHMIVGQGSISESSSVWRTSTTYQWLAIAVCNISKKLSIGDVEHGVVCNGWRMALRKGRKTRSTIWFFRQSCLIMAEPPGRAE